MPRSTASERRAQGLYVAEGVVVWRYRQMIHAEICLPARSVEGSKAARGRDVSYPVWKRYVEALCHCVGDNSPSSAIVSTAGCARPPDQGKQTRRPPPGAGPPGNSSDCSDGAKEAPRPASAVPAPSCSSCREVVGLRLAAVVAPGPQGARGAPKHGGLHLAAG